MGNSCIGGHQSYSNVSAHQSPSSSPSSVHSMRSQSSSPSSVHSVRSQGTSSSAQTTSAPAEFARTQAGDTPKTIGILSPVQQERFLNRHDPIRSFKSLGKQDSHVYSRVNLFNVSGTGDSFTIKGFHDSSTAILRHDLLEPNGNHSNCEADNYNPKVQDPRNELVKKHNYIDITAGGKAAKLAESIPVPINELTGKKTNLVTVKIRTSDILEQGGKIYKAETSFDSYTSRAHSLVAALPLGKHLPFQLLKE